MLFLFRSINFNFIDTIKLNENKEVVRIGGIKYTIRSGVVYDSKQLLRDVKKIVDIAKIKEGFVISQPGN